MRKSNASQTLSTLADLRGKRVGTTHANFLATYPAQVLEIKAAGIDPGSLHMFTLQHTQDSVVDTSGQAEDDSFRALRAAVTERGG